MHFQFMLYLIDCAHALQNVDYYIKSVYFTTLFLSQKEGQVVPLTPINDVKSYYFRLPGNIIRFMTFGAAETAIFCKFL